MHVLHTHVWAMIILSMLGEGRGGGHDGLLLQQCRKLFNCTFNSHGTIRYKYLFCTYTAKTGGLFLPSLFYHSCILKITNNCQFLHANNLSFKNNPHVFAVHAQNMRIVFDP